MARAKEGDRVGAISKADKEKVYLFGFGVYRGDQVPPKGTIGCFGIDFGELAEELKARGEKPPTNPKIELDNSDVVWGCQCWWAAEKDSRLPTKEEAERGLEETLSFMSALTEEVAKESSGA